MGNQQESKLQKLVDRCKCGIFIEINTHRDSYESAEKALKDLDNQGRELDIEPDVRAKMIELNTIIEIHFYPDTPIGFYEVFHYDLDKALTQALECLNIRKLSNPNGG